MKNQFEKYHPLINFIYFTVVLLITMFIMHPAVIILSFALSTLYSIQLKGVRSTGKTLGYMAIMGAMIMIVNPLFNHQGVTTLYRFKSGNYMTLESVIYGCFMAMMLMSVIMWFHCYNEVMTTDKFVYLFGRISPHFSLVLSMTLRFIPRFKAQFRQVRDAQKCIGKDIGQGNIFERIGHFTHEISIMVSWSMENSIETADSMKARGYGLPGRTAYSIYTFRKKDGILLAVIGVMTVAFITLGAGGYLYSQYFPYYRANVFSMETLAAEILFIMLGSIPLILDWISNQKGLKKQKRNIPMEERIDVNRN